VHLDRTWSSTKPNLGAEYTEMNLSDGDSAMTLHHYFYGAWPDHGVPEGKALAQLRALVREVRDTAAREACEVWVHCSAGVGRTGTFIMLSSLLDRATPEGEDETPFPSPLGPLEMPHLDHIARRVDAIREYRCMLVQAPQQLALLYAMLGA
jgi:protein-tyrosine phosphatase